MVQGIGSNLKGNSTRTPKDMGLPATHTTPIPLPFPNPLKYGNGMGSGHGKGAPTYWLFFLEKSLIIQTNPIGRVVGPEPFQMAELHGLYIKRGPS